MSRAASSAAARWLFLLIILLTAGIYYPGLSGDYMFDDMENLLHNSRLELESLDLESLQGAAFSSKSGQLRRPVSMASFALNRYFFGVDPYSYKSINLVIHLLTGLCLFLFSRLLVRNYRQFRNPGLSDAAVLWLPVILSGLWLVHPLNLTSVLYIVQRMTSLATLFTVCGLCLYLVGRNRMLTGKHGLSWILSGLFVFGGLAVFSKENGVLLPLYMLVLEMALFRFRNQAGEMDKTITTFFLLTLLLPAGTFLLLLALNPDAFLGYASRSFSLAERLLTEARVLVFYLKMIVMPSISELGLYHDDIALSRGIMDPPATLYSLIGLFALFLAGLLLLRSHALIGLGILWFFTGHALESTIFPLEIAHEHRNYLADFGIILAVAAVILYVPLRRLAPVIRIAAPVMIIILFAATTQLRATQWSDNVSHAIYQASHHPSSYRSVFSAGRIHARLAIQGNQDSEETARTLLEQARELDPVNIMPHVVLIKMNSVLGQAVSHEWIDSIVDTLAKYPLIPANVTSLRELTTCFGEICKLSYESMDRIYRSVFDNRPSPHAEVLTIYGYYQINKKGDYEEGLKLFTRAVEREPQEPTRWINLIKLLTVMNKLDEAEQQLALFRSSMTHGGNAGDYLSLQKAIDSKRKAHASSAGSDNPESS